MRSKVFAWRFGSKLSPVHGELDLVLAPDLVESEF